MSILDFPYKIQKIKVNDLNSNDFFNKKKRINRYEKYYLIINIVLVLYQH
jgi:hypothetical protein